MTFKDDRAADQSVFFNTDEFAETVTYQGSAITALVSYGQDPKRDANSHRAEAQLLVKASDVAAPAYRDTVGIGSDTWYVLRKEKADDDTWLLTLYRDERPFPR